MCGRYGMSTTEGVFDRFDVSNQDITLSPRYNVSPSDRIPVVLRRSPNRIELMQWGFIPFYAKEPKGIINARAETVATGPTFRKEFQLQRCLIPATGFFEWQKTPERKIPYHIYLKSKELFAFAGIYSVWKKPTGGEIHAYAIITTTPNDLVSPIHNRMPVILSPDDEDLWLNPDETDPAQLQPLLKPYPAHLMVATRVSPKVNNPTYDTVEVIEPHDPQENKLRF